MEVFDVYKDMQARTNGTIFLGVCRQARGSHTELGRQEFVQGCQGQIVESPQ